MYVVVTENDQSDWNDETGVLYHFPKRYQKYLQTGVKVIYYKGRIKDKTFLKNRLDPDPHYFGMATIGEVFADSNSKKGDLFAIIDQYQAFKKGVLAKKEDGNFYEFIPETRIKNYWRDGVREISQDIYNAILQCAIVDNTFDDKGSYTLDPTNDIENLLISSLEGTPSKRYVTTYERDPRLRRQAIAIHGLTCLACGFNFEQAYGEYAAGLIHIHHIVPVSQLAAPKVINPAKDLIPLCANCHIVVHRYKDKTLTLEQLKALISDNR